MTGQVRTALRYKEKAVIAIWSRFLLKLKTTFRAKLRCKGITQVSIAGRAAPIEKGKYQYRND